MSGQAPEPLKILVVEDEAIQRQALAAMCRTVRLPAPVEVAEAPDGAAALDAARSLGPDIVLMDIRMPNQDGLESARRLLAGRAQPPQLVFVTAYDDFAYAREALSLGAADYLLKPVALDELGRVLTAAAERVGASRQAARRAQRVARRLKAALPLLRLEVFRDLVDGALPCPGPSPTLTDRLDLAGVSGRPSLAMVFDVESEGGPEALAEAAAVVQELTGAFSRVLRRELGSSWLLGPAGPGRLEVLCEPPPGRREATVRDWALRLASQLKTEAERVTGRPVSAGVGEEHREVGGLPTSAREASTAVAQRVRVGPGCLVHVSDVRSEASSSSGSPLPSAGALLDDVRLGRTERAGLGAARVAAEVLLAVREAEAPHGAPASTPAAATAIGLAGVLVAEIVTSAGRAALDGGAEPAEVRLLEARTLRWAMNDLGRTAGGRLAAEVEQALAAFARGMAGLTHRAQTSRQGGVVKKAVAFIQANFHRPLTLEDVAREVHVSHYYLSHLLRRESGRSFTDHLTELRVGRARELLAATGLGVNEVAARAGFADGNYFARVFRQKTGTTPSAYRRQAKPMPPAGRAEDRRPSRP